MCPTFCQLSVLGETHSPEDGFCGVLLTGDMTALYNLNKRNIFQYSQQSLLRYGQITYKLCSYPSVNSAPISISSTHLQSFQLHSKQVSFQSPEKPLCGRPCNTVKVSARFCDHTELMPHTVIQLCRAASTSCNCFASIGGQSEKYV